MVNQIVCVNQYIQNHFTKFILSFVYFYSSYRYFVFVFIPFVLLACTFILRGSNIPRLYILSNLYFIKS